MSLRSKNKNRRLPGLSSLFISTGVILITASILLFLLIFYPVIYEELKFRFQNKSSNAVVLGPKDSNIRIKKTIRPVDENFGIVIPKIGANSKIIANVSPFDAKEYQLQLTRGVAHAKGTSFPGGMGNVFLFSHSSVDFYIANRYNSIFYLLDKLEKNDDIYLFYKQDKYKYKVTEKKIVQPQDIYYLKGDYSKKTVTLMTCWPAGTNFKRLVVIGEIVNY